MPKLSAFKTERVLPVLVQAIVRDAERDSFTKSELQRIFNRSQKFSRPYFEGALEFLVRQGLILSAISDSGEQEFRITWESAKKLETYVASLGYSEEQAATEAGLDLDATLKEVSGIVEFIMDYAPPPQEDLKINVISVPASDRIVRLGDNSAARSEAIDKIEEIERVLASGVNDFPLSADERTVILSEIKPLTARLRDGWIRVGQLQAAVTKGSPLVWLIDQLGGTVVAGLATAAITALGVLLKSLLG
jgi:hypothetical protein